MPWDWLAAPSLWDVGIDAFGPRRLSGVLPCSPERFLLPQELHVGIK